MLCRPVRGDLNSKAAATLDLHPGRGPRVPVRDREVVPIVVSNAEAPHLKEAVSEGNMRSAMVALLLCNTLPSRGGRGRRDFRWHLLGFLSGKLAAKVTITRKPCYLLWTPNMVT